MASWTITLPAHTITYDGQASINGGALELKAPGGRLEAAYGMAEWKEVVLTGRAPPKEPIPSSNNSVRVLFEGDDLTELGKLCRLWSTTPQLAAIRAVSQALIPPSP